MTFLEPFSKFKKIKRDVLPVYERKRLRDVEFSILQKEYGKLEGWYEFRNIDNSGLGFWYRIYPQKKALLLQHFINKNPLQSGTLHLKSFLAEVLEIMKRNDLRYLIFSPKNPKLEVLAKKMGASLSRKLFFFKQGLFTIAQLEQLVHGKRDEIKLINEFICN